MNNNEFDFKFRERTLPNLIARLENPSIKTKSKRQTRDLSKISVENKS